MYILKTIRKYGDKERVLFKLFKTRLEMQEEVEFDNTLSVKKQYTTKFECFVLVTYINNEYSDLLLDIDNALKESYSEDVETSVSNLFDGRVEEITKYPNKYGKLYKLLD